VKSVGVEDVEFRPAGVKEQEGTRDIQASVPIRVFGIDAPAQVEDIRVGPVFWADFVEFIAGGEIGAEVEPASRGAEVALVCPVESWVALQERGGLSEGFGKATIISAKAATASGNCERTPGNHKKKGRW